MNQFEWFFNSASIGDLDEALSLYPSGEFDSPTRSTVLLFSLLKHGGGVWKTLADELVSTAPTKAQLEFQVPHREAEEPPHTQT